MKRDALREGGTLMYSIGICDDNYEICLQVEDIINKYCKDNSEVIKVHTFSSGEDVFEFFAEGNSLDLLFLDIELNELNGVELGVKIREEFKNEDTQIVYISAKESYAMDLFQIRPLNFLVKPIKPSKICGMIKKAIELNNKKANFSFKVGQQLYKKKLKDILYFESQGRQIKVVMINEEILFYEKLKNILQNVKEHSFFHIHKSVIVNYHHISEFAYENIVMTNNKTLEISQSKRKEVRNLQLQYEKAGL